MYIPVNVIWILFGTVLVFFMQGGFAMLETGFTRAKNAGNILMKNLLDYCIATPLFWIAGFGIMYGVGGALFGRIDLFSAGDYASVLPEGVPKLGFLIFQTVFCGTAATIMSGAMAGRTKFLAYCLGSAAMSLIVYPISGHWIWGGGWLEQLGFRDFAGSTAVHLVGGMAALAGAAFLGPRIGKYTKDGKSRAILGHNIPLSALGIFILWFCWFGFNGCSTMSMDTDASMELACKVFVNTNLSAACSTLTVLIVTWTRYRKPDVSMTLNGTLAGLVAVTSGCAYISPAGAVVTGIIAGMVLVPAIEFLDQKCKIDDPVGAVGVHGCCGAVGTILTGILSTDGGLLYDGGLRLLGVQLLGVAAVICWAGGIMSLVFFLIRKTVGLRVFAAEELEGLDMAEHGLNAAYPDFVQNSVIEYEDTDSEGEIPETALETRVEPEEAVPVITKELVHRTSGERVLTKVEIVTRQSKFERLKAAMNTIGVTGMTVTQVLGCGTQKGRMEYYRGAEVEIELRPKICVEIVVAKVPVELVIQKAREVLYTGHIGDGKIFVYAVEDAVKVRTGERGYNALQGVDE